METVASDHRADRASDTIVPARVGSTEESGASLRIDADGRVDAQSGSEPTATVSMIMPTVSFTGTFAACGRRAVSLLEQSPVSAELIVVFDGIAPQTPAWLNRSGVTVVSTGRRSGPAVARNLAANSARGEILLFVDADVELAPDALDRVAATFDADPDLAGMFGAYDDEPAAEGVVSQFRNLLHHHTHVAHPGRADTFWSGCGAIRSAVFADVGGFDEGYVFPSVEDIELGMRIASQQGRIILDPGLRCKHLKQWTFSSMVVADIFYRAKPWTHLIMETHHLPATLNIDWRGRICGVLSLLLTASLVATLAVPAAVWMAVAAAAGLLVMNHRFYGLCLRKGGLGFAASSFALHCLYFLYSSITFGVVVLSETFRGSRRSPACLSRTPNLPTLEHGSTSVALTPPAAR